MRGGTPLTLLILTAALAAEPSPDGVHHGEAFETPPHVIAARDAIDWPAVGELTVQLLSDYLQVDTTNPPGNEDRGVAWLAGHLDAVGIPYWTLDHGDGRASLFARVESGTDEPPLCLMHHIDVTTYERHAWPEATGPLSGAIVDGEVWGRGALDMKGMGALELMTLVLLKKHQIPLARDVVLLAVADEEVASLGAREMVKEWGRLGCGQMLNEGGFGVTDALFEGQAVHAISSAEKGVLWIRMHADGRAGHGSTPYPGEAPQRLLEAMEAIEKKVHVKPHIDDSLFELLHAVGEQRGGLTGTILKSRLLTRLLVKPKLASVPTTHATMVDTVHLTGMLGAHEPNVVPSRVSAQYDCRLLPGTTPAEHLARLEEAVEGIEGISFEVLIEKESNGSPTDSAFFSAIGHYAVEGRPYAAAGPLLAVGFTDSLLVRPLGTEAYGYVPFEIPGELLETMHGHGERVPVEQVHEGLKRLFSIVVHSAGRP